MSSVFVGVGNCVPVASLCHIRVLPVPDGLLPDLGDPLLGFQGTVVEGPLQLVPWVSELLSTHA